jgi:type IV secretion system protein TrbL
VWTFGMLALRKADIGEFYAEFARFTIFTGFFWWLLTNGPTFATDIMDSLRTIGGTHALGGGFGTGAAMGAAAMAGAAVATGGAAIAAGAASAAGGAQALMAATSKAAQNVAGGTDIVSRMAEGMADAVGSGGASGGGASGASLSSPLAQAMDGPTTGSSPSSGATSSASRASSSNKSSTAKSGTTSSAKAKGTTPGQQPQGGTKSALGTAGKIVADTAANLAKGSWDVAKERASAGAEAAQDRLSQTVGGKVAAAIKAQGTSTASTEQARPEAVFDGNSLSGASDTAVDAESEVAAFRDAVDTRSSS